MKSRIWTAVLYVVAILIIFGRIGSALDNSHGFLLGIINLYLPFTPEAIGYDFASLGMDFIVFLAVRDFVLLTRNRKSEQKESSTETLQ